MTAVAPEDAGQDEQWAHALHEAGHAAAAVLLGRGVYYATLERDDDTHGHVGIPDLFRKKTLVNFKYGTLLSARDRRRVAAQVVVFVAARAAEDLLTGAHDPVGASGDIAAAEDLLSDYFHLHGASATARLAELDSFASELMLSHRSQIELLAHALTSNTRLTRNKIRDIVLGEDRSRPTVAVPAHLYRT
jgi:ATP-dependent Zn protease